ncbi:MAG: virulence factor [Thermomonas sp.]|uniref:virulence factor n=1 Tax=Thermomonas sp. TaxID=1971895 RepID=UPI0039E59376
MFAIAFDLTVKDAEAHHPKGVSAAYTDIARTLSTYGFERIQGSVYVSEEENLATLTMAMNALKAMVWFPATVRDIRAFRIEQWSDFTPYMKGATVPVGKKTGK